ncbi:hypothetical protein MKX03_003694 [Papaver bracteatum]|nr:hypothetical protein MKX03_003694 [Papaver bracteatum]
MAVGFNTEMSSEYRNKQYNGRVTKFVILSCIMASMGGVLFGYDIGISGGVTSMEPFLRKFFPKVFRRMKEDKDISNYCKFDSQLLTSFTSSLYIAGLVASFFASSITRAYGRKPSILIGGAAFLIGTALGGAAANIYMLILGRVLLGVGVGFANQAVPLYLSEMAPARYRGAISNGFQLSISLGVLSANSSTSGQKIKGVLTLGSFFLPETPNSLIHRGSDQKAKLTLQKVRGTIDVQAELDDLINASSSSKEPNHLPFQQILQKKFRPQLVMAIALPFFQQVTGINVIAFYAPLLFRTIGLGESASLMSAVLTGLVGTCSTFASMFIVDRLGRRVLFIFGGIQMICLLSTSFHLRLCLWASHSLGSIRLVVPSEIFPLEIRSIGQSITVAVNFIFTFIIAQTFLSMLCHFKAGIFFFFGGWVFVMTGFVYFFLPETKNVPIEKMDRIWREHWFWKRIVGEEELGM